MNPRRHRVQSAMLAIWQISRNAAKALFEGARRFLLASWQTLPRAGKWLLVGARRMLFSARVLILLVLLVIATLIAYYALADRYTPFTTDAYVQAFVIQVAPRVEGEVVRVHVLENQPVKKGDLLFEIDPRPFEHRVALLEAKLIQAVQQVAQMESEVAASQAEDDRIIAQEAYAKAVHDQESKIYQQRATTERKYLEAVQRYRAAKADHERSLALTRKTRQALAARLGGEHALVHEIKAQLADAQLDLSWTHVYAPANGYVTNVQLREGSYVHIGSPVLTCIDGTHWWVVANYRENSLEYLQPNQRVEVSFNTYPGRLFAGTIQLVGWGVYQGQAAPSGNLPVVNEPQNWIRLAQRFPVWVVPQMPEGYPLRIGATASVSVYPRENFWLNRVTHAWHKIVATFDYLR